MLLMNGDKPVLKFDLENMCMEVLNNEFLPYALKDYIKSTSVQNFKKSIKDIECLRDYLSGRMLNISRENAKVILNVLALPQTLKTEERVKISLMCRSLSMTDNFWTKEDDENIQFSDICLRNARLSDASYKIAILGNHISACIDDLKSDLLTNGMFAKTWRRSGNSVEMWKTDKMTGNINTLAEIRMSEMLDKSNVNHVKYKKETKDGLIFSVSKCFASNAKSFVCAQEVKDYCSHIGIPFEKYIAEYFPEDFANMAVVDYVFANTDRHFENWGFLVDNETNEITSFAPLFDHNQALIADEFNTNIDELIYEPTGSLFLSSLKNTSKMATLQLDKDALPEKCRIRYEKYLYFRESEKEIEDIEK